MRFPLIVFAALLVGCDDYRPPTLPDAPAAPAMVRAMAFDEVDRCIGGTTIELIKAQTIVETGSQDARCGGVTFFKVTYGEEVTLRASAAGYETQEKTVVVKENSRTQQEAVFFILRRIQ